MLYSDLYLRPKNNIGLMVVASLVMVFFSAYLYFTYIANFSNKVVAKSLKRHELVNVLSTQVSVYWVSDISETGWILYGKDTEPISKVALDDRDVASKKTEAYFHLVTIKNLQPNTTYHYKIVSNNEVVKSGGQDFFTFRTPQISGTASTIKPAYGKLISANGTPVSSGLIIYRYPESYALASLTKTSGDWLIPLQNIVDVSTNQFISADDNSQVVIEATDGQSAISTITALVRLTNPVPQSIILGKNYTFLADPNVLNADTFKEPVEKKDYVFSILLPKENSLIPSSRPLLKGQGIPGKEVRIQINSSPEYITRVKPNSTGSWFVDVPVSLPAGSYTFTATSEDATGKQIVLKRKFTIAKSGEQVLGDATPSGTLSPTASPTAILTSTPSATPIITFTPSPTITQPLFTATPIATMSPSLIPSLGAFDSNSIFWGSLGMIVIGAGLLFVF